MAANYYGERHLVTTRQSCQCKTTYGGRDLIRGPGKSKARQGWVRVDGMGRSSHEPIPAQLMTNHHKELPTTFTSILGTTMKIKREACSEVCRGGV